jgi:hypothetical protein
MHLLSKAGHYYYMAVTVTVTMTVTYKCIIYVSIDHLQQLNEDDEYFIKSKGDDQ